MANQTIIAPSRLDHVDLDPEGLPGAARPAARAGSPDLRPPRLPKGRGGSALGRAVHAVLQVIDLATLSDIDLLAAAAAHDEGVSDLVDTLVDYVRNAASSNPVQRARVRRPLLARSAHRLLGVDGSIMEGAIDLLYEHADKTLGVVDFKSDQVSNDEIAQRAERYRAQGNAYAQAVSQIAATEVTTIEFVFAALDGRSISVS